MALEFPVVAVSAGRFGGCVAYDCVGVAAAVRAGFDEEGGFVALGWGCRVCGCEFEFDDVDVEDVHFLWGQGGGLDSFGLRSLLGIFRKRTEVTLRRFSES